MSKDLKQQSDVVYVLLCCSNHQDWQAWMLGAVLASGGQICVSSEDMQQAGKFKLLTHTDLTLNNIR